MPLYHCAVCHHEWPYKQASCDWCGGGYQLISAELPEDKFWRNWRQISDDIASKIRARLPAAPVEGSNNVTSTTPSPCRATNAPSSERGS